jgi:quercetin dioxygenase-like cupin family protein
MLETLAKVADSSRPRTPSEHVRERRVATSRERSKEGDNVAVVHLQGPDIPNDRAAVEGDGFAVAVTRFEPTPGWGRWHHHGDHHVVAYVTGGTIRIESGSAGGELTEATTGDLIHLEPGTVHREDYGTDEVVSIGLYLGSGRTRVDVEGPGAPSE